MKEDEAKLLLEIQKQAGRPVREIVAAIGMNKKRAASILEKWAVRGWYEYGIAVDLGWLTEAGMKGER